MRIVGLMVAVLAVTVVPRAALAWNETGHMTVAEIAWLQLDQRQRREVGELLKHHPHYEKMLTAGVPEGVDVNEWAFLRAAFWPDLVRPSRPGAEGELYKGPEVTRYHRGDWHYIDKPWVRPDDRGKIDPATRPAATQPAKENVLTALEANANILADKTAKPADRAVALAWILHLVGDIHQPLHAVSMVSLDFPDGDRGGNAIVVRENDLVLRLHAYWDGILGNSNAYEAVAFLADSILEDPQLEVGKLHELAERPGFAAWADESYRWAGALVYLNGRLRGASGAAYYGKEIPAAAVPPPPHGYFATARELARRRVALAGHRLAEQIRTSTEP